MHANRLHLLLPFALPTAADTPSELHSLRAPALDKLLARATLVERVAGEDFQRTLPHERWMARQFGALGNASGAGAADEAPLAPYMMLADGADPGEAVWACVEPVHLRVAHDHLVLLDPASLELRDEEATALFDIAKPLVEELGIRIEAPRPNRWYLSGEALGALAGASPLRASGRSVEIWLPHDARTGARSRAWMKLQNEVQMAWFEHPINEAREARGLPTVNSLWLHAQGARQSVRSPFTRVFSHAAATRGLALAAGVAASAPPPAFDKLPPTPIASGGMSGSSTLVELEAFAAPFIAQDWPGWSHALTELEQAWFAPALAALEAGDIGSLVLTLCGDTSSVTLAAARGDLRRFWRRRVLASLFE